MTRCAISARLYPLAQSLPPAPESGSAELAYAIQARDKEAAQSSMLRSSLENSEKSLEESRSALRGMEQRVEALKAAQLQSSQAAASDDEAFTHLRVRAEAGG